MKRRKRKRCIVFWGGILTAAVLSGCGVGEQDKTTALFGECKWKNEKVDLGVLETLIHRSHLFQHSKVYCFLFSKSGFTKGCIDRTNELGNVTLVEYADILRYYEA